MKLVDNLLSKEWDYSLAAAWADICNYLPFILLDAMLMTVSNMHNCMLTLEKIIEKRWPRLRISDISTYTSRQASRETTNTIDRDTGRRHRSGR